MSYKSKEFPPLPESSVPTLVPLDVRVRQQREEERISELKKFILASSNWLSLPLYFIFVGADYLMAPDRILELFTLRLLIIPSTMLVHFLMNRSRSALQIQIVGAFYVFSNAFLITIMSFSLDGKSSLYYAGLNLCAISVGAFIPWTRAALAINMTLIYLPFYLLCLFHWREAGNSTLGVNTFFMGSTVVIAVVVRMFNENLRLKHIRSQIELRDSTAALQGKNKRLVAALNRVKEVEAELRRAEKFAAIGNMSGTIAHEINTPLGVCLKAQEIIDRGANDFTRKISDSKIQKNDLDALLSILNNTVPLMKKNLERASFIVESYKKVGSGEQYDNAVQVDSEKFFVELIDSCHPLLDGTNHQIEHHISSFNVKVFTGYFSQIIPNLIKNSLIHGFDGKESGRIEITVTEDQEKWILKYSDDGVGVSDDLRDKIFEPFFTTKKYQGGTGLGLSVVYNLVVLKMGGKLRLTSSEEPGFGLIMEFKKH